MEENFVSMSEALAKMSEEMKARLANIWEDAIKITGETEANLPVNNKNISIGHPTAKLNKAISEVLGTEINAKEQNITLRQAWHINDKHGVGNEKYMDQNPVTKETFMLIPDVLENFSTVEIGRGTKDSRKQDTRSIVIGRIYSDGTVILANALAGIGKLEIKTMVLKKPTEVSPMNANAPSGSL